VGELNRIELSILEPVHGQIFVAAAATTVSVPLRGEIVATTSPNPEALFRKWYSSLADEPVGTADQTTAHLMVGSHTITYSVMDKNDDGVPLSQLEALYKSVEHIGAAGGPPDPPPADEKPCVVHVLAANIVTPSDPPGPPNPTLSKVNATLEAQAPLQWGKYVANAPSFEERDPAYHKVNKVRYRWFFTRLNPAGLRIELDVQGGNAMTLIQPRNDPPKVDPPPRLRYVGPLPAALVVNQQYTLTLRVEHADFPDQGHEMSRTVTILP
jgi:hypothetical protein